MTAVTAGPEPGELLGVIGVAVVGFALIPPAIRAYVARFYRHTIPSATAGVRAPRRGRVALPAGLSPEPAGTELAASPQDPRGQRAVETHTPDGASTAPGEQR